MKYKTLEEVKILRDKTQQQIERDFKIQTVLIAVLIILALVICFKSLKLATEYEALKIEKQTLEELAKTQSSAIADLEENCKELFNENQKLKFEED